MLHSCGREEHCVRQLITSTRQMNPTPAPCSATLHYTATLLSRPDPGSPSSRRTRSSLSSHHPLINLSQQALTQLGRLKSSPSAAAPGAAHLLPHTRTAVQYVQPVHTAAPAAFITCQLGLMSWLNAALKVCVCVVETRRLVLTSEERQVMFFVLQPLFTHPYICSLALPSHIHTQTDKTNTHIRIYSRIHIYAHTYMH